MSRKTLTRITAAMLLASAIVTTAPAEQTVYQATAIAAEQKPDKKRTSGKLTGFTVKKDKDVYKKTIFKFSGELDRKTTLYLFDAKTKKKISKLTRDSHFGFAKKMTPLLFVNVNGLSDKEQKQLAKAIDNIKTQNDLCTLWYVGIQASSTKGKKATSVVKEYLNDNALIHQKDLDFVKKQIEDGYGDLNSYEYWDTYKPGKKGTYSFFIATKDKKLKTKVFKVKVK